MNHNQLISRLLLLTREPSPCRWHEVKKKKLKNPGSMTIFWKGKKWNRHYYVILNLWMQWAHVKFNFHSISKYKSWFFLLKKITIIINCKNMFDYTIKCLVYLCVSKEPTCKWRLGVWVSQLHKGYLFLMWVHH
jgi:hypothetical protein